MTIAVAAAVKAGICRQCNDSTVGIYPHCGCCEQCGHDSRVDHHPEA